MSRLIAQKICCWIFHRPRLGTEHDWKWSLQGFLSQTAWRPRTTPQGFRCMHWLWIPGQTRLTNHHWRGWRTKWLCMDTLLWVGRHPFCRQGNESCWRTSLLCVSVGSSTVTHPSIFDYHAKYTYHDLYDVPISRKAFLHSLHRALKDDGKFLWIDHCAAPGRSVRDAGANRGLQRIEEFVFVSLRAVACCVSTRITTAIRPGRLPCAKRIALSSFVKKPKPAW